jgi:transcriptional antiterminator RfaH
MTSMVTDRSWYLLQTKPKQEERALRNLAAWHVETFVPRIAAAKVAQRVENLFPGYIFVYVSIRRLLRDLLFTRGVARVVSFGGEPAVVDDDIIEGIRARTNKNGVAGIVEPLSPGDTVLIRSGAFSNLVGIFEREMPDQDRVQILLTTLSYTARVAISKSQVTLFVATQST